MAYVEEIVVTGIPPWEPPPDPTAIPQDPPGSGPAPGSPGGPPPTALEPAATTYASHRVKSGTGLDLSNPDHQDWFDASQQFVKAVYFNTQFGSKTTIDGPGQFDLPELDLLRVLNRVTVILQTAPVIFQNQEEVGAKAVALSDGNYGIIIDIDHPNVLTIADNLAHDQGKYFTITHELGHIVHNNQGWQDSQSTANTFALGLGDYAAIGMGEKAELEALGLTFSPF